MRNYKYQILIMNILERFVGFWLVCLTWLSWGYRLFCLTWLSWGYRLFWQSLVIGLDMFGQVLDIFWYVLIDFYRLRYVWTYFDMFGYVWISLGYVWICSDRFLIGFDRFVICLDMFGLFGYDWIGLDRIG